MDGRTDRRGRTVVDRGTGQMVEPKSQKRRKRRRKRGGARGCHKRGPSRPAFQHLYETLRCLSSYGCSNELLSSLILRLNQVMPAKNENLENIVLQTCVGKGREIYPFNTVQITFVNYLTTYVNYPCQTSMAVKLFKHICPQKRLSSMMEEVPNGDAEHPTARKERN